MKITVDGVTIELTPNQVALIEKAKAERAAVCKSFATVLKYFGFRKVSNNGDKDRECYAHPVHMWYAEVIHQSGTYYYCWLAGKGLPTGGYPGGKVYDTPEAVRDALVAALDKIGGLE